MNDFNQILTSVKAITDNQRTELFVPSANVSVVFKPLTAKQQKDLIKTAADNKLNMVSLLDTVNSILLTNSITKCEFLVSDRNYIIAQLRAATISPTYIYKEKTYDLLQLAKNRVIIADSLKQQTIETTDLTVYCKIPSLQLDTVYNTVLLKSADDTKKSSDLLGELFIYEVLKYVQKIHSPALGVDITMSDLAVKQQFQLLESLPASLYNKIVEYINKVKEFEATLLKIDDDTIEIDINQGFFTT